MLSKQIPERLRMMPDSEKPTNAPGSTEQTPKPVTAIPTLAQAATERKTVAPSSVLQRVRQTSPRSSRIPDAVFRALILLTAVSVFAIVAFIVWELITKSQPTLHQFGIHFFYNNEWDPVNDQYGARPFLFGTLVSSFLGLLLAVPLSVGV